MLYYLSLGSNLGNREQTLMEAIKHIEQQTGHVLRCSSFYYSAPWGFESPNEFCNLCCAVESSLSPLELLTATRSIEQALGRTIKSKNNQYSDRPIDIDIIRAFDGAKEITWNDAILTLPHPLWQSRDFVKIPLAEIFS